ncbi:S49 family peptidase [Phaeobacter sp. JH20_26]|uniref:S49 family peptidase n=1 Tax=Phaeobacter sp. JH20_26 TaxID=3112483 RepID=UPI003A83FE73
MSGTTIGALLGTAAVAICAEHLPMLDAVLPGQAPESVDAMQAMVGAGVKVERGERYVVHRGIAYVPVRGVLSPNSEILERWFGWATYHGLIDTMSALSASDEVRGVVLFFDTPGGAVVGVQGAVEAVKACAAVKPVHAFVYPLAASAGYWLASQCTEIIVSPGAWVGSVGTMMNSNQPVQSGTSGYQDYILTSHHAGAKRPDLSTDEGRALALDRLNAMEADFHAAVSEGRGIPVEDLKVSLSRSGNTAHGGDVFWGNDAVERGLADGLEDISTFIARVSALYAPPQQRQVRAMMARAKAAQAKASL